MAVRCRRCLWGEGYTNLEGGVGAGMLLPMQGQVVGAGTLSARLGRRMAQQLSQEEFSGPWGLGPCRGIPGATESQGWEGPQASSCHQALGYTGQLWKGKREDGKPPWIITGLSLHTWNVSEAEPASLFP